jgi:AcrR family transcriptional regulator
MKTQKPKRDSTPPEDTRDKLLKAAIQVFSDHGYEGATVRAICHRAGVNLALVKYHYGDKLALYRAVVHYAMDLDAQMVLLNRSLKDNADPVDALRQIVRGVLQRVTERREKSSLKLRLMLNEVVNPTTVLTSEIEEAVRPMYDQFLAVVGRVLSLPVDHLKTRLCSHSIIGQIEHYVNPRPTLSRLWPEMQMSPEQIEIIANHITDFSLAYLRTVQVKAAIQSANKSQRKRT